MTNTNFGPTPNTQPYSPISPAEQPYGYGPPAPFYPPVQTPAQDPGRTLGVVGLILSVVASAIGLVVSIVAHTRSKRAGFRNTAAKAGIIVGSITTAALLTAGIAGGLAAKGLVDQCVELGPGVHQVDGVTYTCG